MTLDEWLGERREERYLVVEVRESGEYEARLGTDDANDPVPFEPTLGSTMIDAVAGMVAMFEVRGGAASSGSVPPS